MEINAAAAWLNSTFGNLDVSVALAVHKLYDMAGGFFTPFFEVISFFGKGGICLILLSLALLESAESEKDVSDIRRELIATGFIKNRKNAKVDKTKAQTPLRFVTDDGLEVLVGRSNIQNDELTTKLGRRTDYWLHTQKIHGSHVILRCEGVEPPERSIEQAAVIAAHYSQGRGGAKIPVDYTMLRFVKKPSGALPGKVIYTDYKTINVQSDAELISRLRKGK